LASERRSSRPGIRFSAALLFFAAAFLPNPLSGREAPAADWKIYAGTDEGRFYFDAESLVSSGKGIVHLRHRANFSASGVRRIAEAFGKEYKDLAYAISIREINCPEKKIRSLGVTYFSKTGEALDAAVDSQAEWFPIDPNAVIEGLYQEICRE
jgi:hypothetical protein